MPQLYLILVRRYIINLHIWSYAWIQQPTSFLPLHFGYAFPLYVIALKSWLKFIFQLQYACIKLTGNSPVCKELALQWPSSALRKFFKLLNSEFSAFTTYHGTRIARRMSYHSAERLDKIFTVQKRWSFNGKLSFSAFKITSLTVVFASRVAHSTGENWDQGI